MRRIWWVVGGAVATLGLSIAVPWALWPTWEVEHTATIDAPRERVWALLADLERYGEWNAYNTRVDGVLAVGEIATATAGLGGEIHVVDNVVTEVRDGERFCWRSQNWYAFLVWGTRCRILTDDGEGTRFVHHELFEGPVSWIVEVFYRERIEDGLRAHDQSLKAAAERPTSR